MAQQDYGPKNPQIVETTTGLFTYLRDLVRSTRRTVKSTQDFRAVVWLRDVPDETVHVNADDTDGGGLRVLSIPYEPKAPAPQLPRILDGRVDIAEANKPGGREPRLLVAPAGSIPASSDVIPGASTHVLEARSHEQQVHDAFAIWVDEWRGWSTAERSAAVRREVYDRLSEIAKAVSGQDDVFEAVFASGLVVWQPDQGSRIHRHLVTRRVRVLVDKATARIEVSLDPQAPLLMEDDDFLHNEPEYLYDKAGTFREQLAVSSQHPLAAQVVDLVEGWTKLAVDRPVRFYRSWQAPESTAPDASMAQVTLDPAIILRVRDRNNVVRFYDRILAGLGGADAHVPLGLAQLVAPLGAPQRTAWNTGHRPNRPVVLEEEPLFPLPTNLDQRHVLDLLGKNTAVVVQGPPGTGKTHTIANLTAAFLAQGLRVLVTSQKDQALTVLREKIPASVRDMCVMLMSGDRSGQGALERTLAALSEHAASVRPEQLEQSIHALDERRTALLRRRARLEQEIGDLREAEACIHEPAPGYRGRLAEIHRLVAEGEASYCWMPLPTTGSPSDLPLGIGLFGQLRDLLRSFTEERHARAQQWFPQLTLLPSPDEFTQRLARMGSGEITLPNLSPVAEAVATLDVEALSRIESLVHKAADQLHLLGVAQEPTNWKSGDWRVKALTDTLGRTNGRLWEQIAASAAAAQQSLETVATLHTVDIPDLEANECAAFLQAVRTWQTHLAAGGRARQRFRTDAQVQVDRYLIRCTIDRGTPSTPKDMAAIITVLEAATCAHQIDALWQKAKIRVEAVSLDERLGLYTDRAQALARVTEFGAMRDRIGESLLACGVRILLESPSQWETFTAGIGAARTRILLEADAKALEDLQELLTPPRAADPAPEAAALLDAVRTRNARTYQDVYGVLVAADAQKSDEDQLKALHSKLKPHRALARMLTDNPEDRHWDDLPAVARAWEWAVAASYCRQHHEAGRGASLENDLGATEHDLLDVTGDLAGAKGWLHCLSRLDQHQKQALAQLRTHLASVGSGEGRYAARARAAARDAMTTARGAVPAWIMPLHQVVDTLPAEPDSFDVVIVDEASQVGLDGLFLLWLAPRMIVVGDNKQCVPGYGGGEYQKFFDRLDQYLPDIPLGERDMFKPGMNLYELLSARFPEVVSLTEHFRSMPEIIGWCSEQFYSRPLIPLRQFGADRLSPPLRVEHVKDAFQQGRDEKIYNQVEAEHLVGKLRELLADPRYQDRTFGVITLQGSAQARRIEELVGQTIAPATVAEHSIRIGKPADFQGDERDVVLLSMVTVKPAKMLRSLDDQRRFNVAVSRARDQLWLFTSVPRGRLKPDDLRASLLHYMESTPAAFTYQSTAGPDDVRPDVPHRMFDSLFEQLVYLRIRERGYAVAPQVPVGAKRIDLVVHGLHGQLAVECDGEYWHSGRERIHNDIRRERELVRAGWRFWRVRESDFAHDPDAALATLWIELAERGITPGLDLPAKDHGAQHPEPWTPTALPDNDEDQDGPDDYDPEEEAAS